MMRRSLLALVAALNVCTATPALATVTTSTSSVTYSPGVNTTVFTVTFPFLGADWLVVTKTLISNGSATTLTRGVDYNVTLPIGSTLGFITTVAAVTNLYTIRIDRVVPVTQLTSFKTQGSFRPGAHEDAFDKLTMIAQQIKAAAGTDGTTAVNTHVAQADPHTQYALLAGRAGGQHLKGGTAASENLQLSSTAHATKGKILLGAAGTSAFDEVNTRLGIGTASPTVALELPGVNGTAIFGSGGPGLEILQGNIYKDADSGFLSLRGDSPSYGGSPGSIKVYGGAHGSFPAQVWLNASSFVISDNLGAIRWSLTSTGWAGSSGQSITIDPSTYLQTATIRGGSSPSGSITISSTSSATKGKALFGTSGAYDEANGRMGVGTTTPAVALDVVGSGQFTSTVTGLRKVSSVGATYTVSSPTDCASIIMDSTDGAVITLPAVSSGNKGCPVTVVNTASAGAALVSVAPAVTDTIWGTCVAVVSSGVANKSLQNTKATQKRGDRATLVSDGTSSWYIIECGGTWAWQP